MKLWQEKNTWLARHAQQKLARLAVSDIKSIAVIKHAAYGDLLCTRPFLVNLRRYFPEARITFAITDHYTRGVPEDLADRVHVSPGRKSSPGIFASIRQYRQLGHHNLLFDLTGNTRSCLISRLNPADFKIGYQHRNIHKYVYDVAILRSEFRFEAETFLEQQHVLGLSYELPLDYAMPVVALHRDKPYCVYFPTASSENKSWPVQHFIELINTIANAYPQYEHIILSGLADWEITIAEQIANALTQQNNVYLRAAGKDDASLIKGAQLLVANDTGIRHLGIATNTATVGIFFNTPPFGYWPRYGKHDVIYEPDGGVPPVSKVEQAVHNILEVS